VPDSRRRSVAPLVAAAMLGLVAGDAARRPDQQWGARAAVAAIDVYRATVSPLLRSNGIQLCRFTPSCSAYARDAFARFGTLRGAGYAGWRLLRCNPWARGGNDPVPERKT
jgi:putative membrane protein insertion efficiency factor